MGFVIPAHRSCQTRNEATGASEWPISSKLLHMCLQMTPIIQDAFLRVRHWEFLFIVLCFQIVASLAHSLCSKAQFCETACDISVLRNSIVYFSRVSRWRLPVIKFILFRDVIKFSEFPHCNEIRGFSSALEIWCEPSRCVVIRGNIYYRLKTQLRNINN